MQSEEEIEEIEEPYATLYAILDELNHDDLLEFKLGFEADMLDMLWDPELFQEISKQLRRMNNPTIDDLVDKSQTYVRDAVEHMDAALDPASYGLGPKTVDRLVNSIKQERPNKKRTYSDKLRAKFIRMIAAQQVFEPDLSIMACIIDTL